MRKGDIQGCGLQRSLLAAQEEEEERVIDRFLKLPVIETPDDLLNNDGLVQDGFISFNFQEHVMVILHRRRKSNKIITLELWSNFHSVSLLLLHLDQLRSGFHSSIGLVP